MPDHIILGRPTVHSTFPNIAYIFAHHHLTAPAFSDHFFVIIQSSPGKVAAVGIHEAGILSTEEGPGQICGPDVRMSG